MRALKARRVTNVVGNTLLNTFEPGNLYKNDFYEETEIHGKCI